MPDSSCCCRTRGPPARPRRTPDTPSSLSCLDRSGGNFERLSPFLAACAEDVRSYQRRCTIEGVISEAHHQTTGNDERWDQTSTLVLCKSDASVRSNPKSNSGRRIGNKNRPRPSCSIFTKGSDLLLGRSSEVLASGRIDDVDDYHGSSNAGVLGKRVRGNDVHPVVAVERRNMCRVGGLRDTIVGNVSEVFQI